jgi:hypothetical protein
MNSSFSKLPPNLVARNLGKHLTRKNAAALVATGKANGSFAELREELAALTRRHRGLLLPAARFRILSVAKRKKRPKRTNNNGSNNSNNNGSNNSNNNNNNGNLSYRNYTKYQPYLNMYRWLNTIKNTVVRTGQNKVNKPLSLKNIEQIKNKILRRMKPVKKGKNMFTSWLPTNGTNVKFLTKNEKAWLSVSLGNNANGELVKMYIEKIQSPNGVALYRIIPQTNNLKSFNHHTYVPIRNYYGKLNGVGYVKTA